MPSSNSLRKPDFLGAVFERDLAISLFPASLIVL